MIKDVDTFANENDNSVLSKGNEIIIPASGETPEDIACASVVARPGIILGGDLNIIRLSSEYDPVFTALSITYGDVHSELAKYAQGKTIVHLHNAEISNVSICYPKDFNEQKQISNYFLAIDSQIHVEQQRLDNLRQMKIACLENMFPRSGEITPPIRFREFDGLWVKSLLGELFKERNENNILGEMLSVTMNQGIIMASENGRYDNSNSDKSHYKVVKVNDIAYNSMRMWQGASGCSPFEGIVSPAYTVIIPTYGIDSLFFSYLFKTPGMIRLFKLNSQGLTSDNWNLKYPAFSKIEVIYPKDVAEQKRIASFFRSLDTKISLQTKRIEKLKQMKAACLSKMIA